MARVRYKIDENYISFTDMMTNLMVIFLFIALSYILEVVSENFMKEDIYNTINDELKEDLKSNGLELSKDLSLKFTPTGDANLFERGDWHMTQAFRRKVDEVWEPYQKIITDPKYLNYIKEIRIEGHTDTLHNWDYEMKYNVDNYEYNLWLSSMRAQNVLQYIRTLPTYKLLPDSVQERLQFLMTANGLSFSKALNSKKEVTYTSPNHEINNDYSRRVEFKLVTSNEKLLKDLKPQ